MSGARGFCVSDERGGRAEESCLPLFLLSMQNFLRCPGHARCQYLDSLCKYNSYSALDSLFAMRPSLPQSTGLKCFVHHQAANSTRLLITPRQEFLLGTCCRVVHLVSLLIYVVFVAKTVNDQPGLVSTSSLTGCIQGRR